MGTKGPLSHSQEARRGGLSCGGPAGFPVLPSTSLFPRMREFRDCPDMWLEVWDSGESLGLVHIMFQLCVWKEEGSTDPPRGPQSKINPEKSLGAIRVTGWPQGGPSLLRMAGFSSFP